MGKGSKRRNTEVTYKQYSLNFMLATGRITDEEYEKLKKDKKKG